MPLIILTWLILFLCTSFLAALEMALSSASRIRIKAKAENDNKKAKEILKYINNFNETITTVIVLNNIINIILPTISTLIFLNIFINHPEYGVISSTVFMTVTLLIFGEIIPKTFGKNNSEKLLYSTINIVKLIIMIFRPVTFVFIKINEFVNGKIFKVEESDGQVVEEELLTMIEESAQDGLMEKNEGELLRNVIEFSDIRVDEILQPKNDVFMIDYDMNKEEILKMLQTEKYSRVPVYKENTDNIIGIISERDFLNEFIKNKNFELKKILRNCDFVPDTLKISKLLPLMQKKHSHMAVVVDEYGTVQGIITVEDILEELVGEIWDEHDEVIQEFHKKSENCYEIIGNFTIQNFNKLFSISDIDTETEDSTIAGYILEKAERIPTAGEIIEDDFFTFKILELEGQKIQKIEVTVK